MYVTGYIKTKGEVKMSAITGIAGSISAKKQINKINIQSFKDAVIKQIQSGSNDKEYKRIIKQINKALKDGQRNMIIELHIPANW
jgi:uncharacterized FlaG/YvyC family protein